MKHLVLCSLLVALALPACSNDSKGSGDAGIDGGADTGTDSDSDTDTDVDTDSDIEPPLYENICPEEVEPICPWDGEPGLHVDELGDGAEVVAAAFGGWLLAEQAANESIEPVVFYYCDNQVDPAARWARFPLDPDVEETLLAIDIAAEKEPPSKFGTVALLCGDQCAIYQAVHDEAAGWMITPLQGGTVPESSEPVGLYMPRFQDGAEEICVYGDGISCFDGFAWENRLPPGTGPVVHALAEYYEPYYEGYYLVAAGESGWLALETSDGWVEVETGTDIAFRAAAGGWNGVGAAGEGGILVAGSLEQALGGSVDSYVIADDDIVAIHSFNAYYPVAQVVVATSGGGLLERYVHEDEWIENLQDEIVPGPLRGLFEKWCYPFGYLVGVAPDAMHGALMFAADK